MKNNELVELSDFAKQVRIFSLILLYHAKSGHPGGSLSCADLTSYLWKKELQYTPNDFSNKSRNRLVLSKGHSVATIYACAYLTGLIDEDELRSLRQINSRLQGHPHIKDTPWVETSTGSLGQGFSVALGMAMGLSYQNITSNVYAILGDGELQEGIVWETAMAAAHHKVNNLIAFIDYNKLQSDDSNENIIGLEPLESKWKSFNWDVQVIDGHNFSEIDLSISASKKSDKPSLIIANTIKGKGVSFMEGVPGWHGSVEMTEDQIKNAIRSLEPDSSNLESRYL